ncbi:MAG: glycosyltransferase [Anaerolineae bacterium]|nr:glycosyltransferase [Anaerolineae bacterium]
MEGIINKLTVSVCITSYNHARYLPATLDSVLDQDFDNFEIVVVDDGSTDDSLALLTDYQGRYPDKVRCYWHPDHENKGISATFNLAAQKAKGTYLAWLGSDDLWLPDKLSKQVKFMFDQPDFGMVYSPAFILDSTGRQYPMLTIGGEQFDDVWRRLLVSNFICASSALIRRTCLDDVGLLDETLVYSDWELWIRIAAKYRIGIVPQPLVLYRIHGQNISVSSRPATRFERRLAVIESVFAKLPMDEQPLKDVALSDAYFEAGLDFFAVGQPKEGHQHLAQAVQLQAEQSSDQLVENVVSYVVYTLRTHNWDVPRCARFIQEVFSVLAPKYKRKAVARLYALEALLSHSCGLTSEVRCYFFPAIVRDPRWLQNGGMLSAGIEAFGGAKVAAFLRRLTRHLVKRFPKNNGEHPGPAD